MARQEKKILRMDAPMKKREVLSIRECFDAISYEDGGVKVVDKKSASQEEEQDALRSYFREMGEMQQLSSEEELALWMQIDENVCRLRHIRMTAVDMQADAPRIIVRDPFI